VRTTLTAMAMVLACAIPVAALSTGAVLATSALFPDRNKSAEETLDSPAGAGDSEATGEADSAPAKPAPKPKKAKKSAPAKR
jgi:hypothetical protein